MSAVASASLPFAALQVRRGPRTGLARRPAGLLRVRHVLHVHGGLHLLRGGRSCGEGLRRCAPGAPRE
eukprot:6532056-Prorocentrum_lima.AAC.1